MYTLRENNSQTRRHHLKICKERCRLNIRKIIDTLNTDVSMECTEVESKQKMEERASTGAEEDAGQKKPSQARIGPVR